MIRIPEAPPIEGLEFRRFEGESDFELLSSIGERSFRADDVDYFETAEDIANECKEPGRDPLAEIVIAEVNGVAIGYGRIWVDPGTSQDTVFWQAVQLVPEWRRDGLRRAMFKFNERQIISIARDRGNRPPLRCKVWVIDETNDWKEIVVSEGYRADLHFFEMVRPSLDDVPQTELPPRLEIRPVKPEHYRKIWDTSREAFRGKPWFSEGYYDDKYYETWLKSSSFQPDLWLVAWDRDEIAGMARNEIPIDHNRMYNRNRGYTQHLSVMPRWRRKGVGKALLAESLRMMRNKGLTEAELDVETQSTTGELHLYESLGYQVYKRYAHYVKLLRAQVDG